MPKRFKSWWDFWRFSQSVRHSARYIHDRSVTAFLDTLVETSSKRHRVLKEGKYLWRAQLGGATREREEDDISWEEEIPHSKERMKPLTSSAHEGRVNPKDIPCLYLTSDKETAMGEVRPWIGGSISVGQFRTTKQLRLVDFSVGHEAASDFYLEEPSPQEREDAIWKQIDKAFSTPVANDLATADYVPTQIISEVFRKRGFDGVVYKSMLGPGINVALFDLDSARLANCFLYSAKSISFGFEDSGAAYYVKDDGSHG